MVLVTGQQRRMQAGDNTWANPMAYDKLAVSRCFLQGSFSDVPVSMLPIAVHSSHSRDLNSPRLVRYTCIGRAHLCSSCLFHFCHLEKTVARAQTKGASASGAQAISGEQNLF